MSNRLYAHEKNPHWRGGRSITSWGYVRVWVEKDHPMRTSSGPYVFEHRLVMAEKLGRWLTSDELVHHIDEDKRNNHPDNLELQDKASHMRVHYANKPRPSVKNQRRENDGRWVAGPKIPREPRRRGYAPAPMPDRLWTKIDQSGGDESCHPWMGVKNRQGYGKFWLGGNGKAFAHRVVFELLNGPIVDPKLVVRHSCDNPSCCNPKHLLLGTRADNARDRGERKRGREHRQNGELNANVKIRDADLPRIRELRTLGWSQQRIADEFGVKQPQISRILRGVQRTG